MESKEETVKAVKLYLQEEMKASEVIHQYHRGHRRDFFRIQCCNDLYFFETTFYLTGKGAEYIVDLCDDNEVTEQLFSTKDYNVNILLGTNLLSFIDIGNQRTEYATLDKCLAARRHSRHFS